MSLWKLRVGAEAYYLAQVASGLDDYYSGHGESAGRWVGHAVSGLGLAGEVSGEDLRAVLAGLAPGTGLTPNGERLRSHPRRVPGFDLTFSVPKSVSVAYALGDPLAQAAVVEAGEAAVGEALAWLEREACHVRRGSNRRGANGVGVEGWGTRRLVGGGFVAAQFRHRVSRAGDPQLHWHVLVANLTRGPDYRWSALDGTGLYRSQRAAGVVFQAALRRELTERLGVEWTTPVQDAAEIAGVPQRIVRLFSKRRAEIEAELDRLGASGSKAAEQATLATRRAKTALDPEGIMARWRLEAETAGWGPVDLDALLASGPPATRLAEATVDVEGVVAAIGGRLVEHDATFTRHQVTLAVAAALTAGAVAGEVDRLTAGVLAHPDVVAVNDPASGSGVVAGWEQRYTTRRLLAVEAELTDAIAHSIASGTGMLPAAQVAVASAVASLGTDQRDVVTRLCTQGNGVEVLIGRAGAGKTYTLAAVASAYRAAGWDVVGVAPSARAARELDTAAGIVSFTVPRFDRHVGDHRLTAATVVVVDEAGMCGTVDLHHVVTTARRAGAKVILVGDHRQLPEVAAGGGLTAAVAALGERVCELTTNRRQVAGWEVDALDQLRHGDVTAAWDAYLAHGRVRVADNPELVHRQAVDEWWQAHTAGYDALLLAGTRVQARTLNGLARRRAADEGLLSGPALTVAGRVFQAGDRVLLCRNDLQCTPGGERVRVDNGMLGTLTSVDEDAGTVDVWLRSGQAVRLDRVYLAGGNLDHGYAMTIHKSQGATCDAVFVVGPAGLYREAAYVALSRARHGATLYATSRQAAVLGERDHARGLPLPGDSEPPEHDLLTTLARSQAKTFATTIDPAAGRIAELARLDLAVLQRRLGDAATAEARASAAGLSDPADDQAGFERASHARGHLTRGTRVRALDRGNVGTVTALHDAHGTAIVVFVADDGTRALRTLAWSALQPIDHPNPVALTAPAQGWLDREAARIAATADRWTAALAEWSIWPGDAAELRRAVEGRRQIVAHQLHADQPAWLTWWVGGRPADPAGASVWDDTIARIAAWRDLHHIQPADPGLGPQPHDPQTRQSWLDAMDDILAQRAWLTARTIHPEPVRAPALSPGEIHERIGELDRLLADAPPDQRRIIADLTTGRLAAADLHAALTSATTVQTDRARWILANWPHVVELHELQRLTRSHDQLAHWPTAVPPAVHTVLDRLAADLDPGAPVEHRTLAELHTALAGLDPGRRLRELTKRLVAVNDRLAHLQARLATEPDSDRRGLLDTERDLLGAQQASTRAMVDTERRALRDRRWAPNDTENLRAAIVHRRATIYQAAVSQRPEWVIELLAGLDGRGALDQLSPAQLRTIIGDAATHRDTIDDPQPRLARPERPLDVARP